MTKLGKKLLVLLLTLCALVAFAGVFVACAGEKDNTITYTVTVKTSETAPEQGVKVTVKKGAAKYTPVTTNAEGKAEFKLEPDTYTVELSELPDHYELPDANPIEMKAEDPNATVVLKKKFAYTVSLVNAADGSAYSPDGTSVKVIICNADTKQCLNGVSVNSQGKAEIFTDFKATYHVKVDGLPKTLAYEADDDGYYRGVRNTDANSANVNKYENGDLTDTVVEKTIKLYSVVNFKDTDKLDDAGKTAFASENPGAYYTKNDKTAYLFKKDNLAKDEVIDFAITPEFSGKYNFYFESGDNKASYLFNNIYYINGNYNEGEGCGPLPQYAALEEGVTYYFKARNESENAVNAKLLIEAPVSSYEVVKTAKTVNVTIGKASYGVIKFVPEERGKFTVETKGEIKAYVDTAQSESQFSAPSAIDDASYVKNSSKSIKVVQSEIDKEYYFAVYAKADSNPVELQVEVKKSGTVADDIRNIVAASGTIAQAADGVEGEVLYGVPFGGAVTRLQDGSYEYNGKKVYVKLTQPLDEIRFSLDGSNLKLAYLEQTDESIPQLYVIDVTPDADKAYNSDKGYTFKDYRRLLRGFDEYTEVRDGRNVTYNIPDTLTDANCYAAKVNKDGAYPLNDQLKTFLEEFVAQGGAAGDTLYWALPTEAPEGALWKFALYYYSDVVMDEVLGTYFLESVTEQIDDVSTTFDIDDEYTGNAISLILGTVIKKQTLAMKFELGGILKVGSVDNEFYGYEYAGTWTKTEIGYTLTFKDRYSSTALATGVATLENGTLNITLTVVEDLNTEIDVVMKHTVQDDVFGEYELAKIIVGSDEYVAGEDKYPTESDDVLEANYGSISYYWYDHAEISIGDNSYQGVLTKSNDGYVLSYNDFDEEWNPISKTLKLVYNATDKTFSVTIDGKTYVLKLIEENAA